MEIKKLPESEVILNLQIKIVELIGKNKDSEKEFIEKINQYLKIIPMIYNWEDHHRVSEIRIEEEEKEKGFNFLLDKASIYDDGSGMEWEENYDEIWVPELALTHIDEFIDYFNSNNFISDRQRSVKYSQNELNSIIKEIASLEKAYENSPSTTIKKMLDKKKEDSKKFAGRIEFHQNQVDDHQKRIDIWNKIVEDEKGE